MLCREVSQNVMMPTPKEKIAFSKRLKLALRRLPEKEKVKGPSDLSVKFSLRYQGKKGEGVSPQTTHKWLNGAAIPKNDKLAVLAQWLDVDEHWLHYGPSPAKSRAAAREKAANAAGKPLHVGEHQPEYGSQPAKLHPKAVGKPRQEAIILAMKIQDLPPHRRYLVEELVAQLQQDLE